MSDASGQPQTSVLIKNFGHSTQLIEINGHHVLTDPHFGRRCFLWPRRGPLVHPHLPPLDAVCISHAHPDHLNIDSFKYIPNTVPVIVPESMSGALRHAIQNPIIELHWWTRLALPGGLSITAVPAKHNGGRWLPLRFRTVCGFLVSAENTTVFFAGDTRMGTHFKEIANTVAIDVALLPIGNMSYCPWHSRIHLTPTQAAEAAEDLRARHVIPIHWGTFGWSKSPNAKELESFRGAMVLRHLENNAVVIPPGTEWRRP